MPSKTLLHLSLKLDADPPIVIRGGRGRSVTQGTDRDLGALNRRDLRVLLARSAKQRYPCGIAMQRDTASRSSDVQVDGSP